MTFCTFFVDAIKEELCSEYMLDLNLVRREFAIAKKLLAQSIEDEEIFEINEDLLSEYCAQLPRILLFSCQECKVSCRVAKNYEENSLTHEVYILFMVFCTKLEMAV